MASIGENAYGKNLTIDNLIYKTLDPPIGGFVNNPLTGNLDCGGKDLTNANEITTGTLNYTTLSPPIAPGITNPLSVDLLCAGKNIGVGVPADKANEIKSVTGTFDNSALGAATGTTLTTTGAVTAVGSTYGSLCNVINGIVCGTGLVATTGDVIVASGIVSVLAGGNCEVVNGDFEATGTGGVKTINGDIQTTGSGKIKTASGNIESGSGSHLATGSGSIECQGSGKVTTNTGNIESTTGNIIATGGNLVAGGNIVSDSFIRSDNGNILASTGRIYTNVGNLEALAGDIDSKVGSIQGQQLKINNPVVNTLGGAFNTPIPDQDMTGISKLAIWVYSPSSATVQFIVETGITDVTQNSTTFLTVNHFSTGGTPLRVVNYRIGALGIAPPDSSKLAVSVTMTASVPALNPIRMCLLVIPDV